MKKLSKEQVAKLDALRQRYRDARSGLEAEIASAQEAVNEAYEKVDSKLSELNAVIEEADGLREEVVDGISDFMSEKGDAWHDGERGSAYQTWLDQWNEQVDQLEVAEVPQVSESIELGEEELFPEENYANAVES